MKNEDFVIERTYSAPLKTVWQAITNRDQMAKWYFELKDFKPEVGFEFRFTGGPPEKQYLHICIVTEVIPEKKLSHTWRYDGYEGNSEVTFELFDEGDKTRVRLTHSGLSSFPKLPDFARANFEAGWTAIIGTNLKKFVEA